MSNIERNIIIIDIFFNKRQNTKLNIKGEKHVLKKNGIARI